MLNPVQKFGYCRLYYLCCFGRYVISNGVLDLPFITSLHAECTTFTPKMHLTFWFFWWGFKCQCAGCMIYLLTNWTVLHKLFRTLTSYVILLDLRETWYLFESAYFLKIYLFPIEVLWVFLNVYIMKHDCNYLREKVFLPLKFLFIW